MTAFFIIALILIVVIVVACNSKTESKYESENLDAVSQELFQLLKMVYDFTNSDYWKDNSGLVMVVPVNDNGVLYSPDSCRLKVLIVLYDDNAEVINLCSKLHQDFISRFNLSVDSYHIYSYSANTFCTFNSNYKAVMPRLNTYVKSKFPDVEFTFDGSRIMAKKCTNNAKPCFPKISENTVFNIYLIY